MQYGYDSTRPDQLKFFGSAECQYDSIGNPKVYLGDTLKRTKERQLKSWEQDSDVLEFDYDGFGRRIRKGKTQYTYTADGKLFSEKRLLPEHDIYCGEPVCGDEIVCGYAKTISYLYDQSGIIGFISDGDAYYYRKNIQGDITAILESDGHIVVRYTYDAWGNHKVCNADGVENADSTFIGNINPIRYRSYYYDTEIQMYFLHTRYYDPKTGRFINADDISYLAPDSINGLNLYSYCGNNPVSLIDSTGTSPTWWQWLLFGIGAALVVAAAVVLVASGGAATGLIRRNRYRCSKRRINWSSGRLSYRNCRWCNICRRNWSRHGRKHFIWILNWVWNRCDCWSGDLGFNWRCTIWYIWFQGKFKHAFNKTWN